MRLSCDGNSDSHTLARFDSLHRTIHLHRTIERQSCDEAGPDPKRIRGFNEHAVRADVSRFPAQDCGAPFNLKLGAKGITRRPAAFQAPRWMLPSGHGTE